VDPADYIWQKQTISDIPDSRATARLRRTLADHIREMMAAGHLGPYYCKRGENDPRWYFTNPGDTVMSLSRAYPYVPREVQADVRDCLQREMASRPPLSDAVATPDDSGASRMDFDVPLHLRSFNTEFYRRLPRAHNLYAVWQYADATGDSSYIRKNWPQAKSFAKQHAADFGAYAGGAAGAIGWARLAAIAGDDQARATAERCALGALAAVRNEQALREPMFQRYGFRQKWQQPFNLQCFHLLHLVPEVARYVRTDDQARRAVLEHIDAAVDHWPMWFVSQSSAFSRYYGESHALSPMFSKMIYPVRAMVERAHADRLAVWVDAEDAPRGDLFFIERLVLALEAHGRPRWEPVP
jgi:hypothetical protein